MQLFLNAGDLLVCRFGLLPIQLHGLRAGQPPIYAVHDRGYYFQIAQHFGGCGSGGFYFLPLRLEKQLWLIEDAFADPSRPIAPGTI